MYQKKIETNEIVLFKLAELHEKYLSFFHETELSIVPNSTRFKEALLHKLKGLQAFSCGRDVVILFQEDIGPAILQSSQITMKEKDKNHIKLAAKIIRNDVVNHTNIPFDGTFEGKCFSDSVPSSLLSFVSTIVRGKDDTLYQAALTISQLIQFNSVGIATSERKSLLKEQTRHNEKNETPIAIYLGLLVHAHHRDRNLIDEMHKLGICIGYDRVLVLSAALGNSGVQRFLNDGVVYPLNMVRGLFTTSQLDNIDHNPSSTTATSSLHGTGISILQHPNFENEGTKFEKTSIASTKSKTVLPLGKPS